MNEEFQFVSKMLESHLSDEPEVLILDLQNIEVWNARMQFLLAEANSVLAAASFDNLPESGTELERKTVQKAKVREYQEERDKIEGLCEAIKTRITLGQSILRYYSTTQNIQYKNDSIKAVDQTKSIRQILGD